jgi:large subunit ribosomal protein L9
MARRQEILLTQDVLKLGNMGDVVRVSPGYARNYLFPYALAIPANQAHKRQIEVLREHAAKSEVEREARANVLRKSMEGMSIQIAARVAHEDELFGSIGTRDIVAALAKSGVEIDGKQVHLHDKIKKLGKFKVELRLHKNVGVTVNLEVVNSDPNAPALDQTLAAARDTEETEEPVAEEEGGKKGKKGKGRDRDKDRDKDSKEGKDAKAEDKPADAEAKPKKHEVKIKNLGPAKSDDSANGPVKGKGKK